MNYMDRIADRFGLEPADEQTKREIVVFMKRYYPGDYEVEVEFKDCGFTVTQIFQNPSEQTMFMLKWL